MKDTRENTREKTIGDILGDFTQDDPRGRKSLKEGRPITIWLPGEAKARYDVLQERSGRRFSKKVRETLLELIAIAESRVG